MRVGGWQVIHVFAAVAVAGGVVLGLFDVAGRGWPSVLFDVVWVVLAWRIMRMGVYVSAAGGPGVRIRTVLRTVTYPWSGIAAAEARGNELWLVLVDGRAVRTAVRGIEGRRGRSGLSLDPGDFNVLLNQVRDHVTL